MMQLTYEHVDYGLLLDAVQSSLQDPRKKKIDRKEQLAKSKAGAVRKAEEYDACCPAERNLKSDLDDVAKKTFIYCWDSPPKPIKELRARIYGWLAPSQAGRCPFCALECEPKTLDHFIEKAAVPELALHARNLVPSCSVCNTPRKRLTSSGQVVFHFYDDEVGRVPNVLCARIEEERGAPTARFFLNAPLPAGAQLYGRHFETLDLARRYRIWAAAVLPEKLDLFRVLESSRRAAVMRQQAERLIERLGPNEPLAALYEAMAEWVEADQS